MSSDDLEAAAEAVAESRGVVEAIEVGDLTESGADGVYSFLRDLKAWEEEFRALEKQARDNEVSES